MTDAELNGMERDANIIRPHEVRRLVAEVRRLKALVPNDAGSTAMVEQLSEMRGERFERATLPGAGTK